DLYPAIKVLYGNSERKWDDQDFLRDIVWPLIKDHTLIHDRFYCQFDTQKLPPLTKEQEDDHIGWGFKQPVYRKVVSVYTVNHNKDGQSVMEYISQHEEREEITSDDYAYKSAQSLGTDPT
ncbi:MAG: hypothetical protein AAF352_08330, partial [Pseudomonadota bacterium]